MAKAAPIDGLSAGSPFALAARRALSVRLSEVRALAPEVARRCAADAAARSDGSEAVHDLRVATRRLRAAIELFGGGSFAEARAEVKRLGDALGTVRDLDVQLAWLSSALGSDHLTLAERAGIERLIDERRPQLGPRERALAPVLAHFSEAVAPRLERSFAEVNGRGRFGGKRLRRRLRRQIARLGEREQAVLGSCDPHTAHQLRKAVKKLRYRAELFEPARPEAVEPLLAALVPLQETIGELHDRDVRLPIIERALVRADSAEQPGLIALLRDDLAERDRLAGELTALIRCRRDQRLIRALRAGLE